MKVEVEITTEQLQEALRRSIKKHIDGWNFDYTVEESIKEAMKSETGEVVRAEMRRQLADSATIRAKVEAAFTAAEEVGGMSLTVRELLRMIDELRDDLSALRAERDALVERANEQYMAQAAEIAKLKYMISRRDELLVKDSIEMKKQSDEIAALRARVAPVREVLARYGINAPSTEEEIIREFHPTLEEER